MLINKEEIYAIKLLLRFRYNKTSHSIERFTKQIGISKVHGYKLTRKLKEAGIIESTLGRKGGYYLSRPLSKISVFDVHKALYGENRDPDKYDKNPKINEQLQYIEDSIKEMLKQIKLHKMK